MEKDTITIPHRVFVCDTYEALSSSGKVLLLSMWICCHEWGNPDEGQLTIKQEEMVFRTKLSLRTVFRVVQELLDSKLMWTCGGQRSSYMLALDMTTTRKGSLTLGQEHLLSQLVPAGRHPQKQSGRGHLKKLGELKTDLLERDCRCYVCGIGTALELHHLTYERYGNEALDDCILLCERCHVKVTHTKYMPKLP